MKVSFCSQRLQTICEGLWKKESSWWAFLAVLSATALCTRLVYLDYPPGTTLVCLLSAHYPPGTTWDEVHFGGFGNKYLNRTFFHDVHPPLGKMLVAAAMKMTGFNSSFPFTVNTLYPEHLHYATLRGVFGVMGASMVPLAFLTVWHLTASLPASVLAAIAILTGTRQLGTRQLGTRQLGTRQLDHFLHRISTLVLLDAPLLMAILASVCSSFSFHATSSRPTHGLPALLCHHGSQSTVVDGGAPLLRTRSMSHGAASLPLPGQLHRALRHPQPLTKWRVVDDNVDHDYITTITPPRSHHHDHTTTTTPPRPHHHDHITTITLPRSHHHDHTTTTTLPR
ncbi:Glycosyl transferase family 39/83 [Trinorchestia longiramus]|nr:Glycosyl transferase family 39/83 [Trinorchestia longiramus]